MKFDIGSARNTPFTPREKNFGRRIVRGVTMITFLKMEKNTAYPDFPRDTKTL